MSPSPRTCVCAGFAPVLAYCTSLGVTTILLTTLHSPKHLPGLLPDLRSNSLAAACKAVLPWQQSAGKPQLGAAEDDGGSRSGSSSSSGISSSGISSSSRSPLTHSVADWHRLDRCIVGGDGFIEPWLYLNPRSMSLAQDNPLGYGQ